MTVAGSMNPAVSLSETQGGQVVVSGDLTLNVPFALDGGSLEAASVTSSLPLTAHEGTVATDRLEAPDLNLTSGSKLTSLATTVDQVHTLEILVPGVVRVDTSSKIDVSGKGYLPGYTIGNTTDGGATRWAGGSYGGAGGRASALSPGQTNLVYGDYADPDEPGSGGGIYDGGYPQGAPGRRPGSDRGRHAAIGWRILADGQSGANFTPVYTGGSGGGVLIDVGILAGAGVIRAAGGRNFTGGGGGGGRVAVYARNLSGLDPSHVTAPGGPGSGGAAKDGDAGSVYIVQGHPHTHVRSHSPYGVPTDIVDQGNGYVKQPIDAIILKFNQSVDTTSFDPSLFEITGQMGAVRPTGMTEVGDRTYRIDLPFRLSENGPYHFRLLPSLLDSEGSPLDQDADGTPGEAEDAYTFSLIVDTKSPRITNHTPDGDVAGTIDHVDIWFSETIDTRTFSTGDIRIAKPNGNTLAATGIQNIGLNRYRIGFPVQYAGRGLSRQDRTKHHRFRGQRAGCQRQRQRRGAGRRV